jgi:hypothetical protein
MSRTALDLEGKDNASRAFQSATDHLKELRAQIDKMKGGQIDLGAKDAVKNVNAIAALERQYTSFEKKLQIATGTGAQATGMLDKLGLSGMTAGKALGMLGVIAGPAMFLGIAQGAANAVIGLDAMREESEQISARFVAQAGSTRSAADGRVRAIDGARPRAVQHGSREPGKHRDQPGRQNAGGRGAHRRG